MSDKKGKTLGGSEGGRAEGRWEEKGREGDSMMNER